MRYDGHETVIVGAEFPPGLGAVEVQILNMETMTLLALSDNTAQECLLDPGLYTFSLANVVDPIIGFTQAIVRFRVLSTGDVYRNKVVLRGYVDEVRKTKALVATTI
jgi:hypothetical protein